MLLFTDDYAFMGSLIIQEVVNELLTKGLDSGKVLLLAGSRSVHRTFFNVHATQCTFVLIHTA